MSARMEKVREALEKSKSIDVLDLLPDHLAAALAEVEEWETEREFCAGTVKALLPYQERAVAAEAALVRIAACDGEPVTVEYLCGIARAAEAAKADGIVWRDLGDEYLARAEAAEAALRAVTADRDKQKMRADEAELHITRVREER